MAFGTGSAIAHRVVDGVAGPRTVQHEWKDGDGQQGQQQGGMGMAGAGVAAGGMAAAAASQANACEEQTKRFTECISQNQGSVGACQFYFDLLSQCQNDASENAKW